MSKMAYQIFVSHTKKDERFCDEFDRACARVGIKSFRSEFETISPPPWQTIRDAMRKARAMFLLVGPELVATQALPYEQEAWKYTQNWIAYEIGLACQHNIDVWVLCDQDVEINFPVPYFNNYAPYGLRSKKNLDCMIAILNAYNQGSTFDLGTWDRATCCAYNDCQIEFNLHAYLPPGGRLKCPGCLQPLVWEDGWLQ